MTSVVVIGAGPRGTGFLERLAANAPELYADLPLEIHLVDPHPPGGGRIWRPDQSPLLWMNSMAEDVTMFTDDTVTLEGPVLPGPTLAEWAGIDGRSFPSRRQQGAYLRWVYEEAVAALPPAVTVHEHRARALRSAVRATAASWSGSKGARSRSSPISSCSPWATSTPNWTTSRWSWRTSRAAEGSSTCRRTSPQRAVSTPSRRVSRSSSAASGSHSSI